MSVSSWDVEGKTLKAILYDRPLQYIITSNYADDPW